MITFPSEVRDAMFESSNGFCQCSYFCTKKATEFDHRLPNTKVNNKLFPLFLHSVFNCCPINRSCHDQKGKSDITLNQAKVYEDYLIKLRGDNGVL